MNNKQSKEVIISAYDKDYSWVNQLDLDIKVTVYRKGDGENCCQKRKD